GTDGDELWKSDGTESGTVMVKDIYPGIGDYGPNSSSPQNLTDVNGRLFFTAVGATNGRELWKSDGTGPGTVMVKDIYPEGGTYPNSSYPSNLTDVNGSLFFEANDGTNGSELWTSDGTEPGTVMVKNINNSSGSYPGYLTNVNGRLFFTADDGVNGTELWISNGTESGTVLVKDLKSGPDSSDPDWLTAVEGTLFFSAETDIAPYDGHELWMSDGTQPGTLRIKIIRAAPDAYGYRSYFDSFTNVNGLLFFTETEGGD
ncbi:MAG: hypothetical protein GY850_25155, partial [bacterium]|nr:hypothetical protein [bacterium]